MPPSHLLRPLGLDLLLFACPLGIGMACFFLGRLFHRWSAAVRATLVGLAFGAILVVTASLLRSMPEIVDRLFSYVGGVVVVLCWMILGVIGISWNKPHVDFFLRFLLPVAPLALIAVEAGGSLWFRFYEPDSWIVPANPKGVRPQLTAQTCLPAVAVTLLDRYGINGVSEGELAYWANTSYFGTDAHMMARVLSEKLAPVGRRAEVASVDYETAAGWGEPFIAQIKTHPIGQHSVYVVDAADAAVTWIDPLEGWQRPLFREEFEGVWAGTVLRVVPR